MHVHPTELVVLQAITDHISCVGQMVATQKIWSHIERVGKKPFDDDDSAMAFSLTLGSLVEKHLVSTRDHKGVPHLTITHDAMKVDELDTTCCV